MSGQQSYFRPLTTLRFVAALYVVLFHTLPGEYRYLGQYCVNLGYSSVSFFFILSGFVLAIAYAQGPDSPDPRAFWRARFARIYPLFLLTVCLDLPNLFFARLAKYGFLATAVRTTITFLATVFMLQAWWPQRLEGLDNPNWSLSVEAVFYLLFPLIAASLWRRTGRSAVQLLLLFYASGLVLVAVAMRIHLPEESLFYLPVLHLAEFVEGILIARLFVSYGATNHGRAMLHKLTLPIVCGTFVSFYCLARWPLVVPKPLLHDGALLLVFGPLIVLFASGQPQIEKIFSQPLLVLLGEASYGLYLWHMVLWHYLGSFVAGSVLGWRYVAYLLFAVALSVFSFRFIEQPARRWLLRSSGPRIETRPASALSK